MNCKKAFGTFLSFVLSCSMIQAVNDSFPSFRASAENQQAVSGSETAVSGRLIASEDDEISDNPFDKQDDMEVPYDRTRWIQPAEWNCPAIDPKDYEGGVMLYFDKIGLQPEHAAGVVQRIYFSAAGVTDPVNLMKFHIFYDTRLKIKRNGNGDVLTPGKAIEGFTTGSAMVEEGQLVFYAYSDEKNMLSRGSLLTIDFIVPEDEEAGEVYPIGLAYVDDGIAYDCFINSAKDNAGKLQMAYVFTRGIYNGYIRIIGEKRMTTTTTVTTPAPAEPLPGDVNGDGYINIADAVLICRIAAEDPCDDVSLTEQSYNAADFDADGLITVLDTEQLLVYFWENFF